MAGDLRCLLGFHSFPWPPHKRTGYPFNVFWQDFDIECARGCGARQSKRCHADTHWQYKHPEPPDA